MASRKPRGLSLTTLSSKQHRKYLGDSSDPHFVPKSPLIERQQFSEKDEAELKRLCTLALVNVPHSDDMTDDPFRYLAQHILTAPLKRGGKEEQSSHFLEPTLEPAVFPEGPGSCSEDTATPSETSKRETLQTDDTTPVTTPGITPGESGKRFSDAGGRPSTAAPSQLRTEVRRFPGEAVYSFLKDPVPTVRPQTSLATKSLTHLPSFVSIAKPRSKQVPSEMPATKQRSKVGSLGKPDFNKSLPALPKIVDPVNPEAACLSRVDPSRKQKPGAISRMLKTVHLKRTQSPPVVQARSTSTDVPCQLDLSNETTESPSARKQRRFNITHIFQKGGGRQRVTVG